VQEKEINLVIVLVKFIKIITITLIGTKKKKIKLALSATTP